MAAVMKVDSGRITSGSDVIASASETNYDTEIIEDKLVDAENRVMSVQQYAKGKLLGKV